MIAVVLILESFHEHIDKRFIYISIAFSLFVEVLNIRARRKSQKKRIDTNNDQRDLL